MRVRPPLVELTIARIKEFLREREAIFWVFFMPLLFALVLGFAFRSKPPERIPVAVATAPAAAEARMMQALARSPYLAPRVLTAAAGREALRSGAVALLVEPAAPGGEVTFHYDPTRPDSRIARLEAEDALERAAGRTDLVPIRSREIKDRGARYIDFLLPGLLGMNLMSTGIWSLAFSITNARNRRVLKRLVATPMRRGHFLLAQVLARLGFLGFEVVLLVGFGWLAFGVGVRGSLPLLALICLLGAMCFSGLGLLIASRVTSVEGASGLTNLTMLPMWLCSGVFFSSQRFPAQAQPFIQALPLTALNNALRAVINDARPFSAVAPSLALLTAWTVVAFAVALKIFKWK